MGKKVECAGMGEDTDYNHKAVKSSVSTTKSRQVEVDYSIKSKNTEGKEN